MYAETDNGFIATKKGITVNVKLIPELLATLQKAEGAAVRAGLLGEAGASSTRRGGYRPGAGRKKRSDSAEPQEAAGESTCDNLSLAKSEAHRLEQ